MLIVDDEGKNFPHLLWKSPMSTFLVTVIIAGDIAGNKAYSLHCKVFHIQCGKLWVYLHQRI
jgi:hypothetical protein